MKTSHLILAFAAMAITLGSCVEKSGKYKALLAERDSLKTHSQTVEANYNETIGILNDVEDGFAAIRQSEGKLSIDVSKIAGENTSKKEQIAVQMNQIKSILAKNREKIAQLQKKLNLIQKENSALAETIKRMEAELTEKTALIASLQDELAKKNIKIEELNTTVSSLNTNVQQLSDVSKKQQATIKTQETNLNTVWYCIASSKDLKNAKVVTSNGLFRSKTLMDQEFDKSIFTQTDMRNTQSINTGVKKAKVLSAHPKDSYRFNVDENNISTLEITDPAKFWSISKYLVIQK